jgi:hypothetical protein
MLFLLVFLSSLVALHCGALFPCDFFHVPLLSNLVAPSHDAPLVHASWWSSCSKLWCSSCSCLVVVQLLQAMMFLLLLFQSSLVIIGSWYFCSFFHDALLFHVFSTLFLNSCFLAYQNHNNCDPLSFPPTSCSFNYELGGCKRVRTCPFAWCLAIVACLAAHCAFVVNPRFTP